MMGGCDDKVVRIPTTMVAVAASPAVACAVEGMDWAYPATPKGKGPPDKEKLLTVPGSQKQYTAAQIGDDFNPPDWFPNEHPAMPAAVATGRQPGVRACALCHLPTGGGHPESANMAGLPVRYSSARWRSTRTATASDCAPPP